MSETEEKIRMGQAVTLIADRLELCDTPTSSVTHPRAEPWDKFWSLRVLLPLIPRELAYDLKPSGAPQPYVVADLAAKKSLTFGMRKLRVVLIHY